MDRLTNRHGHRQKYGQTDRWADRQMGRQTDGQTDRWAAETLENRHLSKLIYRWTGKEKVIKTMNIA
jgi:hypothetical protein